MKVLAFLQNMWVKDPAKVQVSLDRWKDTPEFWNRMVASLLFSGCITGRRIKTAFGDDLAFSIIYDECTKEIADNPKVILKPDFEHIANTIKRIKPDVIITFGNHAYKAVTSMYESGAIFYHTVPTCKIIVSPHPAARQPDTLDKLKAVAEKLNNN